MRWLLLPLLSVLAACVGARDPASGAVTYADGIASAPDVTDIRIGDTYQRLRIVRPADTPKAVLVLFSGGDGHLGITTDGTIRNAGNFLIRTREQWASHGFLVIIPDVPADHPSLFRYRLSDFYRGVLAAIVDHARTLSSAPIWLMGTSAGTPSALFGAASLPDTVHGAVVSSAVTLPSGNDPETVFSAGLDRIRAPVLIQYHRDDTCFVTPPDNVPRIKAALTAAALVELQEFGGGLPPRSSACEARAAHGFYGIESQVVDAASAWMLTH
jgi:pimeloyl-ACP methyl ester carboxylesterase